jgi:hypothetical protein
MVHSDWIVVVLLHKHFGYWLSNSYNSISIIMNCTYVYTNISTLTLWYTSAIHSTFSCWCIMSNFSSILIFFCWLFTCITLGDIDLCFSFSYQMPMLIKGELHELCLCQIMLNQTLLCEFEGWCKFLNHIKPKLRKNKSCKKETCLYWWEVEV